MPDEPTETRVSYRRWPRGKGGGVIAILWDVPANPRMAMMYEHVGQHGEGQPGDVVDSTRPATLEEYQPLHQELTSLGYSLTVVPRRPADQGHGHA